MPRILVTNDDGIDSVGLHVLARAMRDHGDVVVVAPDSEYSGSGAALGALHIIHPEARRTTISGIAEAWTINGPPGLCAMFARLGVFGRIDLIVSGINPGANVGRAVYHSGTVGAALTARNGGISGVAVSQAVTGYGVEGQGWDEMIADQQWDSAAHVGSAVVGAVLGSDLGEPVVVNVNVPNLPLRRIKNWCHATIGLLPPRGISRGRLEPVGGRDGVFAVRMEWGDAIQLPPDTDGGAIERDEVTITYLSRIDAEPRSDLAGLDAAMDDLLAGFAFYTALMIPAEGQADDSQLTAYRASIDNIDAALIHLLAERFKVTQAVGRYKADIGLPPSDPAREAQQIARLRALAVESGLDPVFSEKFLRFIVDEVIHHHRLIADDR